MKLRSGVTAAQAVDALTTLRQSLQSPRNLRDEAAVSALIEVAYSPKINAYLDWAETAEKQAQILFSDSEFADGTFTDRYWHIAGLGAGTSYGTRIINQELESQNARLGQAIATLSQWQQLGARPGTLLALDTNAFLQCQPYSEIPWPQLVNEKRVRLILTMPILDEIEAKKRGDNVRLKKRARKILPRIDKAFGESGNEFVTVERNGKPIEGVTLEILHDPPGQRRLTSDVDFEFLDRCEFLQGAAGRPVTVVTADTGMKIRVRERDGLRRLTVPQQYQLAEEDGQTGGDS